MGQAKGYGWKALGAPEPNGPILIRFMSILGVIISWFPMKQGQLGSAGCKVCILDLAAF